MNDFFVDLHIHIGQTVSGRPVKISGSKDLTLLKIAEVAAVEKGMQMIGIIDCHVPEIQHELRELVNSGIMIELPQGGLLYQDMTIILGSEIEIMDEGYKPVHYLCFFPTIELISSFTKWLATGMKNVTLSSQRLYKGTRELQRKVKELEGIFIPAHIFTPFKGLYGSAVNRMDEICDLDLIDAVELGLSGDSQMADTISELAPYTFVTNSDAHSLGKIAREYQKIKMSEPSFIELKKALHRIDQRKVVANYGLSPRLGKYHISVCLKCGAMIEEYKQTCSECGGKVLKGVAHRVQELATTQEAYHPEHRPQYIDQIPLEFFPGVGKKTYERLLALYSTEMNILHHIPINQIQIDFGDVLANMIDLSRQGMLTQQKGGGGVYGKVILS